MARGINKLILVGNVGNDPEMKYTQDGTAIAKFSLATSEKYKGRDGQDKEKTEWHRCVAWGKLAEIVGEYVRKGSQLYVEGKVVYSDSTGDDGVKRYYTDIKVSEMQMLGGKDRDSDRPAPQRGGGSGGARGGAQQRQRPAQAPNFDEPTNFDDEDIPFATNRSIY